MKMRLLSRLGRDRRGGALIEFALASPILIMLAVGMVDMGAMLHASAGMRHAIGEGARLVKAQPSVTEQSIRDRMRASASGFDPASATITITRNVEPAQQNARYADFRVAYDYTLNVPFMSDMTVNLVERRRVYVPNMGGAWPPT